MIGKIHWLTANMLSSMMLITLVMYNTEGFQPSAGGLPSAGAVY